MFKENIPTDMLDIETYQPHSSSGSVADSDATGDVFGDECVSTRDETACKKKFLSECFSLSDQIRSNELVRDWIECYHNSDTNGNYDGSDWCFHWCAVFSCKHFQLFLWCCKHGFHPEPE